MSSNFAVIWVCGEVPLSTFLKVGRYTCFHLKTDFCNCSAISEGGRVVFKYAFTVQPCGSCSSEWKDIRLDSLLHLKKGQPTVLLCYQAKQSYCWGNGEGRRDTGGECTLYFLFNLTCSIENKSHRARKHKAWEQESSPCFKDSSYILCATDGKMH